MADDRDWQVLAAKEEIRDLLHRSAELVDAGDFAGVGALFAHATVTAEGTSVRMTGSDEIEAAQRDLFRDYGGARRVMHVTTNAMIDVDDDRVTASSRAFFTVLLAIPGEFALAPILAGRYHDRFECVDGAWRFTSRHTFPDLVGEVAHHLRVDFGAR